MQQPQLPDLTNGLLKKSQVLCPELRLEWAPTEDRCWSVVLGDNNLSGFLSTAYLGTWLAGFVAGHITCTQHPSTYKL